LTTVLVPSVGRPAADPTFAGSTAEGLPDDAPLIGLVAARDLVADIGLVADWVAADALVGDGPAVSAAFAGSAATDFGRYLSAIEVVVVGVGVAPVSDRLGLPRS
jgi:hypothetical protein